MSTRGPRKAPRRTAERILEAALGLFNRFGEPNVSTTAIAAELGISPGNLYYHYPAKEKLVDRLFDDYERGLQRLLAAAPEVRDVEDAWLFFHVLFELIWQYRFLYRDLNDLLTRNRRLETQFQAVLARKQSAVQAVLDGLVPGRGERPPDPEPIATAMVVVLTYWLSFEYARDPRHALEPERAGTALLGGARHVLSLLMPYLPADEREHLRMITGSYRAA